MPIDFPFISPCSIQFISLNWIQFCNLACPSSYMVSYSKKKNIQIYYLASKNSRIDFTIKGKQFDFDFFGYAIIYIKILTYMIFISHIIKYPTLPIWIVFLSLTNINTQLNQYIVIYRIYFKFKRINFNGFEFFNSDFTKLISSCIWLCLFNNLGT